MGSKHTRFGQKQRRASGEPRLPFDLTHCYDQLESDFQYISGVLQLSKLNVGGVDAFFPLDFIKRYSISFGDFVNQARYVYENFLSTANDESESFWFVEELYCSSFHY